MDWHVPYSHECSTPASASTIEFRTLGVFPSPQFRAITAPCSHDQYSTGWSTARVSRQSSVPLCVRRCVRRCRSWSIERRRTADLGVGRTASWSRAESHHERDSTVELRCCGAVPDRRAPDRHPRCVWVGTSCAGDGHAHAVLERATHRHTFSSLDTNWNGAGSSSVTDETSVEPSSTQNLWTAAPSPTPDLCAVYRPVFSRARHFEIFSEAVVRPLSLPRGPNAESTSIPAVEAGRMEFYPTS